MNKAAELTASTLPVLNFKSCPVVTTSQLAILYGTDMNNIKVNHSRNKTRFTEGKHYFTAKGQELKALKSEVTLSNSAGIAKNVNQLTLWTERGAARHAKMLDTDKAWDVFEQLEECYFSHKAAPVTPSAPVAAKTTLPAPPVKSCTVRHAATRAADGVKLDPVITELLGRCTDTDITMIYTLFGYMETGKKFEMKLSFC